MNSLPYLRLTDYYGKPGGKRIYPWGLLPEICLLDPDGDLFEELKDNAAPPNPHWACYHTE